MERGDLLIPHKYMCFFLISVDPSTTPPLLPDILQEVTLRMYGNKRCNYLASTGTLRSLLLRFNQHLCFADFDSSEIKSGCFVSMNPCFKQNQNYQSITPPQNRGGVLFSLYIHCVFVLGCLCLFVKKKIQVKRKHRFWLVFAQWLLTKNGWHKVKEHRQLHVNDL